MTEKSCPHCGEEIRTVGDKPALFCQHCGKAIAEHQESPLSRRLRAEKNPKKKHAMIQAALAENPDDFDANRALLHHGRLHEPFAVRKGISFANIKCHLLSVLEKPSEYTSAELDEKYEELLRGEQLRRTMALAPDADAFFDAYLLRLASEYVDLFLRGDSRNSGIFGFPMREDTVARRCARTVRAMLEEIDRTPRLDAGERASMRRALCRGYAQVFPSYAAELRD